MGLQKIKTVKVVPLRGTLRGQQNTKVNVSYLMQGLSENY